ncbi:unnamed protein product [Amoebophrya sp. A25]|nr:unnamed protein product [Amoebophrya sp. A25]|eukprot:GSA25T00020736001.1
MVYFFVVFLVLYVVIGFLGHWMFGTIAPHTFRTIRKGMNSQFEMIIVEFPFDDENNMSAVKFSMFFAYLFMLRLEGVIVHPWTHLVTSLYYIYMHLVKYS